MQLQLCVDALRASLQAQQQVSVQQTQVTAAITACSRAVATAATAPTAITTGSSPGTTPSTSTGATGSGGGSSRTAGSAGSVAAGSSGSSARGAATRTGSGTGTAGAGSGTAGRGGATDVASATAAVANAQLALAQAKDNRSAATLVAPINGRVAAMPYTAGSNMTTSQAITIIGPGAVQVTVDIPQSSVTSVRLHQHATVTGQSGVGVAGSVTAIGLLASATTSTTSSYPMTVTAPRSGGDLGVGTVAAVVIDTATVQDATVVPISAINLTSPTTGTVTVLSGTTTQTTRVTVGLIGSATVEITSGLTAGQQVVLADTTQALPASNALAGRRLGAGGITGVGGGTRRNGGG